MSAAEIEVAPELPALELAPDTVQVVAGTRPPRTWGPRWAAAIVRAQAAFPKIEKNAEATVTSERASYKYSYAELGLILERVQPVLGDCGLAVLQDSWTEPCLIPDDDGKPCRGTKVTVVTTLLHESGEFREWPPLIHAGIGMRISEVGALLSFLRRYAAVNALRVAPFGEDTDSVGIDDRAPPQRPQSRQAPQRRGVTTTNPRGDAEKNADPKKVALYVAEMSKAAAKQDDLSVRQMWDEVKADQDTAIVVWDTLKKQHGDVFGFIDELLKPKKSTGPGRRS
jgi:hypothetical protein